jgi:hypothetical protein
MRKRSGRERCTGASPGTTPANVDKSHGPQREWRATRTGRRCYLADGWTQSRAFDPTNTGWRAPAVFIASDRMFA